MNNYENIYGSYETKRSAFICSPTQNYGYNCPNANTGFTYTNNSVEQKKTKRFRLFK